MKERIKEILQISETADIPPNPLRALPPGHEKWIEIKADKITAIWENWLPTSENINSLPIPIRKYIHDLETNSDPAGIIAENTILHFTIECLSKKIVEILMERK